MRAGERGSLTVREHRLSYLEWGDTRARPLLLLHWGTGMAADWEPYARLFSGAYHVLAPDLLGRGHSDRAKDLREYGKYESLADVEAFVDALELDDIVVLGSSFGAAMAVLYGARAPERVAAVVMDDGGPPVERVVGTLLQHTIGARTADFDAVQDSFDSIEDAAAYPDPWCGPAVRSHDEMREYLKALARPNWILRRAEERFIRREDGTYTWRTDMRRLHEGLIRYYQGPDPADPAHWDAIRSLRVPALCLHAMESQTFDAARRDKLAAANRAVRIVDVAGSAHTVLSCRPLEFFRETTAFLAEVVG
jgi:pimeloyl-ACP methyl ester carboxylesterase